MPRSVLTQQALRPSPYVYLSLPMSLHEYRYFIATYLQPATQHHAEPGVSPRLFAQPGLSSTCWLFRVAGIPPCCSGVTRCRGSFTRRLNKSSGIIQCLFWAPWPAVNDRRALSWLSPPPCSFPLEQLQLWRILWFSKYFEHLNWKELFSAPHGSTLFQKTRLVDTTVSKFCSLFSRRAIQCIV